MINNARKIANYINKTSLVLLVSLPSISHAATIESILNRGVQFLQGPVAKAAGLLAIVASGFLCLFKQQLPKEQFMMILVGLGIIFGGSSLYSSLIG